MIPRLSRHEFKITHHTENQDHLSLNGKGQSLDVNSEMTLILSLSDKNIEAAITRGFSRKYTNMLQTNQKIESLDK